MNNIYKVIWSKAKNCYVVASEIAKSHTKSASGSEKMGGYGKRALLALAAASAIFCGGLVNVGAVDTVHVDESSTPAAAQEVYTKAAVDTALDKKADKDSVYTKADTYTKTEVNNAVDKKADKDSVYTKADTYTKTEVNAELAKKADASNVFTKDQTFTKDQVNLKLADYAKTTDVNTALAGKANAADVYTKTDVDGKLANKADKATTLAGYGINDAYTKGDVDAALNNKADKTYVDTEVGKKADKATTLTGYGITDAYTKTEVDAAVAGAVTTAGNNVDTKLTEYAKTTYVDTEVGKKADKATTLAGYGITDAYTKGQVDTALGEKADKTALTQATDRITTNEATIAGLTTKTTKITYDAALGTNVDGVTFNAGAVTGVTSINGTEIGTKESGEYIHQDNSIWGNMKKVDTQVKTNADDIKTNKNAITALDTKVGTVGTGTYLDSIKSVGENLGLLDAGLKQEVADRTAADTALSDRIGTVTDDGEYIKKSATNNVSDNLRVLDKQAKTNADAITETNQRTAGITRDDTRNETIIEGRVTVDTDGNIKAEGTITSNGLNAGDGEIKTNGKVSAGNVSTGTLETTGDATIGRDLTVKGTLNTKDVTAETIHISKSEDTPAYKSEGSIIGEGGNLSVSNKKTDKSTNITKESELNVNEEGTVNWATSTDGATGNVTEGRSEVTADKIKNSVKKTEGGKTFGYEENITADGKVGTVTDKDGNRNELTQTATGTENTVTSKDGNKSTTKQEAGSISSTVYDKDGNVKASSEMKEDGSIFNNATGDMTNTVGGQLKTTVTGQATEEFKNGLDTTVNGTEKHTVNGKQINTVTEGQENNISGGQINNILTGNQETTVSNGSIINKADNGDISNTAKNVTNVGTESVTNTVGANEVKVSKDGVDIKAENGKKITESVGTASRVVENDKITDKATDSTVTTEKGKGTTFGKEGSTGTTNIYGDSIKTGKINAENTTTGKLTAGAAADADGGRLTVDARDGVKGSYKSGKYTSKSYILANTLKSGVDNGKEPTEDGFVGSRTDHYMDGDKAKLDETVKDADGSNVTNKTSTGTVTTITDGTGTTTTKTEQGTKDITNTAKDGTITNDAKDIVNNAKNTITNTAGTSITNQVKDSKVTTDVDGTTFENKTAAVSDGGTTTTKINGNRINTGRVDANELGVSDKDDQGNTAGLSVKAGEGNKGGIKGSVTDKDGNKTYTKVTATENSFQVQDKDGKNTNHQVNTKDKSENTITNGTKANTVTSTADGTTFNNSKANTVFEGGTYTDTTIKGNTITTGKVKMDYAEVMKNLGVHGSAKVDNNLEVGGTTTTKTLMVKENAEVGGTLKVAKKATFEDSVSIAKDLSVGGDVTANSYKVGDKTYISAAGINANDQKITNVADGSISEGSKDAVNGGQLYQVKNDLEGKVNKVGANAAAMANLHPMEFDPSSKWNIAAAMGNYGSETATAIGAFYRPNEDVMVNFSTAFGTGENMVGGGVSVRLGKGGNKLSRQESNALKAQVNDLTARMDALLSVLNPNMSKDFPDVPENHWAYEAVSRLAGNDIVQGYPDGEFHGDRTMTRYEMAEIIYNALSRGAEAEKELVEEFKPELQAMAASEKATAERAQG